MRKNGKGNGLIVSDPGKAETICHSYYDFQLPQWSRNKYLKVFAAWLFGIGPCRLQGNRREEILEEQGVNLRQLLLDTDPKGPWSGWGWKRCGEEMLSGCHFDGLEGSPSSLGVPEGETFSAFSVSPNWAAGNTPAPTSASRGNVCKEKAWQDCSLLSTWVLF